MTDTVTLPRADVERALEALSLALSDVDWRAGSPTQPAIHKAFSTLRAALAQQQAEPVAHRSDECRADVYSHGESVCMLAVDKAVAEAAVQIASRLTGDAYDWHYIGGRVHVKRLKQPAPAAAPDGWRIQRNADGSIGLFAPPPRPGESRRTSESFTAVGGDANELVFKFLSAMLAARPAAPQEGGA